MNASQIRLDALKPEYCEYSEPLGSYFRCKLTDFGFVKRCTVEDKRSCPDLEFFRNQQKNQERSGNDA
jgi:hypothetical protein